MVPDTVEREVEQKNLHAQIQIPSLIRSWVGVWWEQDRCDEADLEHLRTLQGPRRTKERC